MRIQADSCKELEAGNRGSPYTYPSGPVDFPDRALKISNVLQESKIEERRKIKSNCQMLMVHQICQLYHSKFWLIVSSTIVIYLYLGYYWHYIVTLVYYLNFQKNKSILSAKLVDQLSHTKRGRHILNKACTSYQKLMLLLALLSISP